MGERKLSVVIVDDEPLARRGLRLRLGAHPDIEVVAECGNGREALAAVGVHLPDLMFLDIRMPGMDGMEVVRQIQADAMPLVVFVTAYDRFAVEAFELHAIDYLLKPVDGERLDAAVERARQALDERAAAEDKVRLLALLQRIEGAEQGELTAWLEETPPQRDRGAARLTIRDGSEVALVPMADIDWVDAAGDYMCVHACGQTHVMRSTMKALERQLDPERFARIHRSTIVNIERVVKVGSHINGEFFLTLTCGTRLKMSRTYRDRIDRILAAG
ncbi:MAG: response regulator transcription factor [Gammaproteobacteria bacterium]|nr:response regulator transcription factor [Gammaproteobacteria bacterium]